MSSEKDKETQSEINLEEAVAEISSDLFGQDEADETVKEISIEGKEQEDSRAETVEKPAPSQTDDAKIVEGEVVENTEAVQAVGAPKTWTKEALEKWATVDPRVQQEVLKREEDFLKGITQYKSAAELGSRYHAVVEPYAPILAAENIDPVQLFQSFAANHYLLSRGTPQQKIELAANMLQGYQIPLAELLNYIADQDVDLSPSDPAVKVLQDKVSELTNLITISQTAAQTETTKRIDAEIEAFASDPTHPYFNELANDIYKLFAAGMASSLTEAYEKAVYANPATRQKEIDRISGEKQSAVEAEEKARKDKISRSTAANVETTPHNRNGTVLVGSMDDTLEETLRAIQARG